MVNLMEPVSCIIAILAVVIGTCFSVVGVSGYFRLPDVYTRLHACTPPEW
jgi:multicomponent Na+:H+ antiporter subunit G